MLTPIEKAKLELETIKSYEKLDGDCDKVAEFLNNKYSDKLGKDTVKAEHVDKYISKMNIKINQPVLIVVEEDAKIIEHGRHAQINLLEKTNQILERAENHISEIERHYEENARKVRVRCPAKNCKTEFFAYLPKLTDKEYHQAKNDAIKTVANQVQHLRSTQIKFMELAKNQLLRDAIMEAIKGVDPDIADEVFRRIEQKQREFGMI